MPDRRVFGSIREAPKLLEKAKSVIERFGSGDPAIAPPSLCGIYALLCFLDENDVHIHANESQLDELRTYLQKCLGLLEIQDPREEGSLSYTWPMSTEVDLRSALGTIDSKLVRLRYHATKLDDSTEPPSARALDGASSARRRDRRNSIKDQPLNTSIKLRTDVKDELPRVYNTQLVNIADKDEISRVLQFTSVVNATVISHQIKKGTLPYTDNDLRAKNANFNQPQTLVIKNKDGYQIDSFCPRYEFQSPDELKQFIETVREREVLDQFLPDMIYRNKDKLKLLARCKIVRVWLKHEKPGEATVTITFENKLANGKQQDWDLRYFCYPVRLTSKRDGVELRTIGEPFEKITFLFDAKDSNPAKELANLINEYHPNMPRTGRSTSNTGYTTDSSMSNAGHARSRTGSTHGSTSSASGARSSADRAVNIKTQTPSPAEIPSITNTGVMHESPHMSPTSPKTDIGTSLSPPMPIRRNTLTGPPQMPRDRTDFDVAIICALTLETDAVEAALDKEWDEDYGKIHGDSNYYSFGCIGPFNVVVVHMGGMGKISATTAAIHCCQSFPKLKLGLVVGVCGAIPTTQKEKEIVLGDVIISTGVVQYDFGREYPEGFMRRAENPFQPANRLKPLLNKLQTRLGVKKLQAVALGHLQKIQQELQEDACYPTFAEDKLFDSTYRHRHRDGASCTVCRPGPGNLDRVCDRAPDILCKDLGCENAKVLRCIAGNSRSPAVHFGRYASGDKVMKSGEQRDLIARKEGIIAFEMEGAAIWEPFSGRCLVIKGVCDYADSHKSKGFQNYAAATAAAVMKAVLGSWSSSGDDLDPPLNY